MIYKNIFKAVSSLKSSTNFSRSYLIKDIILSSFKCNISLEEYQLFNIYNIPMAKRLNILTKKDNKRLIKLNNDKTLIEITKTRHKFNKKFYAFLNYKWLELTGENITEFSKFIEDKEYIYAKYDLKAQNDTKKIKIDTKNYTNVYNDLYLSKMNIIESAIEQEESIKRLNPDNLSFIRFIMFNNEIIASYLVTSKVNSEVIPANEIIASINIDTGLIDSPGYDFDKNVYEEHPLTKEPILWLPIPKWPRTKRLVTKIATTLMNDKYLSIDIVVTNDGPSLKDISLFPNYQEFQLLNILNHHDGLKNKFIKKEEN